MPKIFDIIKNVLSLLNVSNNTSDYLDEMERRAVAKGKNYLEEKSDYLDEYSNQERENRECWSWADRQTIIKLRRKEELARKRANCIFSKNKWRALKKNKAVKMLNSYAVIHQNRQR